MGSIKKNSANKRPSKDNHPSDTTPRFHEPESNSSKNSSSSIKSVFSDKANGIKSGRTKLIRNVLVGFVTLWFVILLVIIGVFLASPAHIRYPKVAHHHFRMQLIVDGTYIDFADPRYQETYESTICSGGLTATPIHVHDNVDQMIHIHWAKMTGGEVLKYFGLNKIGGPDDSLGMRFDQRWFKSVPINGERLPESKSPIYVYQIKDGQVIERDNKDFLYKDIETFFGKKSTLTIQQEQSEEDDKNSKFNLTQPNFELLGAVNVLAHSEENNESSIAQSSGTANSTNSGQNKQPKTQEEIKALNDVLGDVIIYVQQEKPTQEEVQSRVDKFIELKDSKCGG